MHILNPLGNSDFHHPECSEPEGKGQPSATTHVNGTPFRGPLRSSAEAQWTLSSAISWVNNVTTPLVLICKGVPLSIKGPLSVLVTGKAGTPKGTCETQGKWSSAGPSLSLLGEPGLGNLPAPPKPARCPLHKGLALAPRGPDTAGTSWEASPACLGQLQATGCLRPCICLASSWTARGCPPPYRLEGPPGEEVCSAPPDR